MYHKIFEVDNQIDGKIKLKKIAKNAEQIILKILGFITHGLAFKSIIGQVHG